MTLIFAWDGEQTLLKRLEWLPGEHRVVTSRKRHSQPWASVSRLRAAMTLRWRPLFAGWGWELGWARVQRPCCGPGHGARRWQGLAVRHGKLRPAGLGTPACAAAVLTAWVWTAQNWNCLKNVIKSHCQNHTTAFPHTPLLFFFSVLPEESLSKNETNICCLTDLRTHAKRQRRGESSLTHRSSETGRRLQWEELLYSPPLQSQHMGFSAVCTYCFIKEVRFCYFYKISTVWIYKFIAFLNRNLYSHLSEDAAPDWTTCGCGRHNHALAPKVGQEDPSSPSSQTPAAFSCPTASGTVLSVAAAWRKPNPQQPLLVF